MLRSINKLMHGFDFDRNDGDLSGSYVVEKLDGWRVRWTGTRLFLRSGKAVNAPDWFTEGLPRRILDCELWAGRGARDEVSRAVASKAGNWRSLRLMIFDAPTVAGDFALRHAAMMRLDLGEFAEVVPMEVLPSMDSLPQMLERVVSKGGEGLMIHRRGRSYRAGRVDGLLKFKPQHLAEFDLIARQHALWSVPV